MVPNEIRCLVPLAVHFHSVVHVLPEVGSLQTEHKPFAINIRHFTWFACDQRSRTARVSLLDRRHEVDMLTHV
jgi:hypothetical protein